MLTVKSYYVIAPGHSGNSQLPGQDQRRDASGDQEHFRYGPARSLQPSVAAGVGSQLAVMYRKDPTLPLSAWR